MFSDIWKEFKLAIRILIKNPKLRFWIIFLIVVSIVIWVVFFDTPGRTTTIWRSIFPNKPTVSNCGSIKLPSYTQRSDFPVSTNQYVAVSLNRPIKPNDNFNELRKRRLSELLMKADSLLKFQNATPYASKLLPLLTDTSIINRKIIEVLSNQYYIFYREEIDSLCNHLIEIRVGKANWKEVRNIIGLAESPCVYNSIEKLIIKPLQNQEEVNISLQTIFSEICGSCPENDLVKKIYSDCGGDVMNCDKVFFESGRWNLSLTTMIILNSLNNRLNQSNSDKYVILFKGYTDPKLLNGSIPYSEGSHALRNSCVILPDNGGEEMHLIENNIQLSYARGFSCYKYLIDKVTLTNNEFKYTGCGVSLDNIEAKKQRAVVISISKKR